MPLQHALGVHLQRLVGGHRVRLYGETVRALLIRGCVVGSKQLQQRVTLDVLGLCLK